MSTDLRLPHEYARMTSCKKLNSIIVIYVRVEVWDEFLSKARQQIIEISFVEAIQTDNVTDGKWLKMLEGRRCFMISKDNKFIKNRQR